VWWRGGAGRDSFTSPDHSQKDWVQGATLPCIDVLPFTHKKASSAPHYTWDLRVAQRPPFTPFHSQEDWDQVATLSCKDVLLCSFDSPEGEFSTPFASCDFRCPPSHRSIHRKTGTKAPLYPVKTCSFAPFTHSQASICCSEVPLHTVPFTGRLGPSRHSIL